MRTLLVTLFLLFPTAISGATLGSQFGGDSTNLNFGLNVPKNSASQWIVATPFTCASACTPQTAYFRLKIEAGAPTDGLEVNIYDQSGSLPNAVVCSGANIDPTTLSGSFSTTSSALSCGSLTAGTYWLTINRSKLTTDNANYVRPAGLNTNVNACGRGSPAGSWAVGCTDHGNSNIYFLVDGTLGGGGAAVVRFGFFEWRWW